MTTPRRLRTAAVTLLAAFLFTGCTAASREAPAEDGGVEIPAVEVVQARHGAVPLRERLTGTVRAAGEVAIYPQVSGPVIEVLAQNGDEVTKGQPLVRIQAPGARAQIAQVQSAVAAARAELKEAEAQAADIEAEYQRNAELGKRGLVPRNLVDTLRSQADAARAAVASAAAQVKVAEAAVTEQQELQAQTVVRAPIAGRVGQRNVEVGMRVDAQTPLFVIGRLENLRVEVPVAQEVLTRLAPGQPVELLTGTAAPPIEAQVSRISPFLEPGSFSAEVEIDVPNESGSLVPGMFVTVDIYYGETDPATLVPTSAVYEDPASGERGVYVTTRPPAGPPADGATPPQLTDPAPVRFRPVEVIAEAAQTIGVTGVQPGEWVVVIGQHLLSPQGQGGDPQARIRTLTWERVMEMQGLQREDLLREFLERQRRGAGEG